MFSIQAVVLRAAENISKQFFTFRFVATYGGVSRIFRGEGGGGGKEKKRERENPWKSTVIGD